MLLHYTYEHNGGDTLLWLEELPGGYARGASKEEATKKLSGEAASLRRWMGLPAGEYEFAQSAEHAVTLNVRDADSDVLLNGEREALLREDYEVLKRLALRSAEDFLRLYLSVPGKDVRLSPIHATFYGECPVTARQMYVHTKNVNDYYFGEIGLKAGNEPDILVCRAEALNVLEQAPGFLGNAVVQGSYGEFWSLRKVLRRFLWHDRIHAKAMWRGAVKVFGAQAVADPFGFGIKEEKS